MQIDEEEDEEEIEEADEDSIDFDGSVDTVDLDADEPYIAPP